MTFGEFMDKLNELYVGNERDYNNMNVMVSVDGTFHPFYDFVLYPGEIAMSDRESYDSDRVVFEHSFVDGSGKEVARTTEGEHDDKP